MDFLHLLHVIQTGVNLLLLWFLVTSNGRRHFRHLKKHTKRFIQRQQERHARQWRPKSAPKASQIVRIARLG